MNIRLSQHAREQMTRRNIPQSAVYAAAYSGKRVRSDAEADVYRRGSIHVVLASQDERGMRVVVTAYRRPRSRGER